MRQSSAPQDQKYSALPAQSSQPSRSNLPRPNQQHAAGRHDDEGGNEDSTSELEREYVARHNKGRLVVANAEVGVSGSESEHGERHFDEQVSLGVNLLGIFDTDSVNRLLRRSTIREEGHV